MYLPDRFSCSYPYSEVGNITTVQLFQLLLRQHAVTLRFLIISVDERVEMGCVVLGKEMRHPRYNPPVSALLKHVETHCRVPPTPQVLTYGEVQVFNVTAVR